MTTNRLPVTVTLVVTHWHNCRTNDAKIEVQRGVNDCVELTATCKGCGIAAVTVARVDGRASA